jgi:hypothetical protein
MDETIFVSRLHDDSGYFGRMWMFQRLLTATVCTSTCSACNRVGEALFRNCIDLTDYRLHCPVSSPSCVCMPSLTSIVLNHLTRHTASFPWRPEPLLHCCENLIFLNIRVIGHKLRDFRLPRLIRWELRSPELLRSEYDVSGQPIVSIFEKKNKMGPMGCPETSARN